jgi:hypothetical protein
MHPRTLEDIDDFRPVRAGGCRASGDGSPKKFQT